MKLSLNKKFFRKYDERSINSVHEIAPATYQTFKKGGEKYFQLDIYTIKADITADSLEQSDKKIQFDKETAKEFISLLKKELDIQ
jgi:hypothetical protein